MAKEAAAEFPPSPLRAAIVLAPGPETCEVFASGERWTVSYAAPFRSRAAGLRPGHLIALAAAPDGTELVVWRWFDAVVLGGDGDEVAMWEPAHGNVLVRSRHPERQLRVGSRAYLSAGLPGADWWVAAPADGPAEHADVELEEVRRFYAENGFWDHLG